MVSLPLWLGFSLAILVLLGFEIWQNARRPHALSLREASTWSILWIALSICFGIFIWIRFGSHAGSEFFGVYLVEKSLSLDNLFVFLILFRYYGVESKFQPRVLEWGVLGALVIRLGMILGGVALLARFEWLTAVFGIFLIYAAISFLRPGKAGKPPEANRVVKLVERFIPVTRELQGHRFVVRSKGKLHATPLLLALLSVEFADIIFALDSIPAAFSITRNAFLIFSANACAILGLRALYFVLAGLLPRLRYLERGLGVLLLFLAAKMLASRWIEVPIPLSLAVISVILLLTIAFSLAAGGESDASG